MLDSACDVGPESIAVVACALWSSNVCGAGTPKLGESMSKEIALAVAFIW